MNAELLLAHLKGVRKSGSGWTAKCPAHADRTASLSLTEVEDKVLLHCFAGCDALSVVRAIGLELSDLFAERLKPTTGAEREAARRAAREANWTSALNVLSRETTVVACAAGMLRQHLPLTPEDDSRLTLAMTRIDAARKVLNGH